MKPPLDARPRLATGCRLSEKDQQPRVLHMPERILRLNGPSIEIVKRCDGTRTVREIVTDIQKMFSKAEPERVENDILGYLDLLHNERALDFLPEDK